MKLQSLFDASSIPENATDDSLHGIGLSICMSIVKAHAGELFLNSEPDGGTEFIFTLPLKQ